MTNGSKGTWIENIRRSQLITPYGIGSIMPTLSGETYMIAGLDFWDYGTGDYCDKDYIVKDDRLTKRLMVTELRLPPDYRDSGEKNRFKTIPVFRFPAWYYCPVCGSMERLDYKSENRKCMNKQKYGMRISCSDRKYKQYMIPERMILVCPSGHISDVDFMSLVHEKNPTKYNPNTCKLRRISFGSSASISNLKYECSCGEEYRFNNLSLNKEYMCNGAKPWLGIDESSNQADTCNQKMKITQRASLNVWFPETMSSIKIPYDDSASKNISALIEKYRGLLEGGVTNGQVDKTLLEIIFKGSGADMKTVIAVAHKMIVREEESRVADITDAEYRNTEYVALSQNYGSNFSEFHSVLQNIDDYNDNIDGYFSGITIVKKLKETRAFIGFSRIQPISQENLNSSKVMLSKDNKLWLPAIEVYGEGIFIKLNENKVNLWKSNEEVIKRIGQINKNYRKSKYYSSKSGALTPEFVLIHTLSHLIINQLSYECGYSAASIRERIYSKRGESEEVKKMFGFLLYTASGDSEGSLGGLSRMGYPGYLEKVIENAITNARWCSADPICIQSKGQGPESTNLAACYNCVLLPETSCENGNRFLDRALLIGDLNHPEIGYFNHK